MPACARRRCLLRAPCWRARCRCGQQRAGRKTPARALMRRGAPWYSENARRSRGARRAREELTQRRRLGAPRNLAQVRELNRLALRRRRSTAERNNHVPAGARRAGGSVVSACASPMHRIAAGRALRPKARLRSAQSGARARSQRTRAPTQPPKSRAQARRCQRVQGAQRSLPPPAGSSPWPRSARRARLRPARQ